MASRLRIAKPVGSKLVRPVGSGLRVPGGGPGGLRKPSPQPFESPKPSRQPVPSKKQAGVVQQGKPVRSPAIKPATEIPSTTANGGDRSLEVGDRVLVNGKQGVLAFLGETQFARGEWGGVVLDSLEGKNNGSVNGVQYFECEPSKGLFSKLEKIKLVSKGTNSHPPPPAAPSEQFKVGDQVLVDGQKQGTIGFLGTTQFARGVWAGIVMEGPEGKNDGTVAGIKYFDCEPFHGLFTRPQKLRLVSKSDPQLPQPPDNVHFQEEGQRSEQPTPTDLKQLHNQLKIGDQVLVGGIKEGILRYLGPTEFAKGVWVGVELPEPMGKNDGAISGKRYFQCEAKHGLFAPLPKVEKLATAGSEGVPSVSSPSSSLYNSAAAASQKRLSENSVVRGRRPSESSVSSYGSARFPQDQGSSHQGSSLQGVTATDLSFLLQEKDVEIETLQSTLDQREKEKIAHQEELTELRRQVDDLQFQLEEQGVISGDQLETATEGSSQKVKNLSQELEQERRLTQQLRDQLKSNEGVEGTGVPGSEAGELQRKLEESAHEISAHHATIATLTEELQQARERAADATPTPSRDLDDDLSQTRQELEAKKNQCTELERALAQARADLGEEQDHFTSLQRDSTQLKEELQGASGRASSLEQEIVEMEKTMSQLQEELKTSHQDLESAIDVCSQHESLIEERNKELNSMEERLRHLTKEQELWLSEKTRLQSEQERVIAERDRAIAECDAQSTSTSMEQNEMSQQRRELLSERDSLLAQQQAMHTEHEKLASERDELLHQLNELQDQRLDMLEASQQMGLKFSTSQGELIQAQNELTQLELALKSSRESWELEKFTLQDQIELSHSDASDVERRISEATLERDSTLREAQDLADRLEKVQSERDSLKLELETAQVQVDELQFQLDELNTRYQGLEHESTGEVLGVQQRLEETELLLSERERELANAQDRISCLSDDLKASLGKLDMGLLEEEKQLLEERVEELTLQLEMAQARERRDSKAQLDIQSSADNGNLSSRLEESQIQLLEAQTHQEDLLQEIEDYKQQTEFLNSVISDLQNKLEGVEAMKGLHGALGSVSDYAEDDDAMLDNLPPPRLFCDICDIFDEHDTDDCPMQTMSTDSPPHSMNHGAKAPGGSDRPYCENCEVFGHYTDQCEYEATY